MRTTSVVKGLALLALSATIVIGGMVAYERQQQVTQLEDSASSSAAGSARPASSDPTGDVERPVVVKGTEGEAMLARNAAVMIAREVDFLRVSDVEAAIDEALRRASERESAAGTNSRAPELSRRASLSIRTADNSIALTGSDGTLYIWYVCALQQPATGAWQVVAQQERCRT